MKVKSGRRGRSLPPPIYRVTQNYLRDSEVPTAASGLVTKTATLSFWSLDSAAAVGYKKLFTFLDFLSLFFLFSLSLTVNEVIISSFSLKMGRNESSASGQRKQPSHGLGTMSPEQGTFVIALRVLSALKWAEIITEYVAEFRPERIPRENDLRSKFSREFSEQKSPLRRALTHQEPIAASDHSRVTDYLRRHVPTDSLNERGRAFMDQSGAANPAFGASQAHCSVPQAAAPAPSFQPSAAPVQQDTHEQEQVQGAHEPTQDTAFGFVFPAPPVVFRVIPVRVPGPAVQEEHGREVDMESPADEEESEPDGSIYPDPELYPLGHSRRSRFHYGTGEWFYPRW